MENEVMNNTEIPTMFLKLIGNEVMNNTEIPAMFLKLNGKWGYEQYGNTSHVFKT